MVTYRKGHLHKAKSGRFFSLEPFSLMIRVISEYSDDFDKHFLSIDYYPHSLNRTFIGFAQAVLA